VRQLVTRQGRTTGKLRVGVIGCGVIARKAHLPVYRDSEVDIVGVADADEQRARSCARKFRIKKWYTNHKQLLNENLNAVSICTPPATHREMTVDAAKEGTSVLVEKPMATSLQDADLMVESCRNSGVKLCVVQNYRFFPCVLEAKRRLDEGRLGHIVSVHAIARDYIEAMSSSWRFREWGVLDEFGPHVIDIINYLFGSPIEKVKVVARDYTGNLHCMSHVQALLLLENSACVDVDISWNTGAYEFSIKILGTAGTMEIDVRNNHLRETHGYSTPLEDLAALLGKSAIIAKAVLDRSYFKGALFYHKVIIREFLRSVAGDTRPPVLGEEGRAVIAVIDSIKRSMPLP
jgi:predicted dehydrogenase